MIVDNVEGFDHGYDHDNRMSNDPSIRPSIRQREEDDDDGQIDIGLGSSHHIKIRTSTPI